MPLGGYHHRAPPVAGIGNGAGGSGVAGSNGEIHLALGEQGVDLLRRALMQLDAHLGEALPEAGNHSGEHVAGLGMGGGDGQGSVLAAAKIRGHSADVLDLAQHPMGAFQHQLARIRHRGQAAPRTPEERHAQLVLQQLDLFADSRLGSVEALGRGRDVQVVLRDRGQVSQLL